VKISVIGAGYVGLTTAACLAQIGHAVFCSESDPDKLHKLQAGIVPMFEPHLEKIFIDALELDRLTFGSTEEAIDHGEAIFICVGTPPLPMETPTYPRSKRLRERSPSALSGTG
jgi:UDPglucose 6-dehydrogenase